MAQEEIKAIWQTIRNRWLPEPEKFLYYWVLGTVFTVPLLVFNYGYNASIIRQFVLLFLVAVGWLIWASRARRIGGLAWQGSVFNLPALILLAAILVNSLVASDIVQAWGGRGVLGESNPWGWLSALGLGLLIIQVTGTPVIPSGARRFGGRNRGIPLLIAFLLSSTLLALLVLSWWAFARQLVMPAFTSFAAASLFFSANAVIITALSLPLRGQVKLFWLGVLLAHVAVIFAYDYDLAWYVLAAAGLALSVAQLLLEKRLAPPFAKGGVDFRTPFALIILSLVLLFVPVKSISTKLGFSAQGGPASGWDNMNTVGATVSWPRFIKYTVAREKLLGAGLGQGTEQFWQLAELVDMRQARQFPPLGNGWGGLLWDGGALLMLAWLAAFGWLGWSAWRFFKKANGPNLPLILSLTAGALGWFVVLALMPFDWFGLFSLIILAALLGAALSSPTRRIGGRQGLRSFLSFGAFALVVFLIGFSMAVWGQIRNRLDFFNSIQVSPASRGTTVDLNRLDTVIKRTPGSWGYRLARVDFFGQALDEQSVKKDADLKPLLVALQSDLEYLAGQNLSGQAAWQVAWTAEKIAAKAGKDESASWQKRAAGFYEKAIAELPRNVIFLTEAARFYRQQMSPPLPEGGLGGEGVDSASKDKNYQHARELADKALAIDNTYEPAYGEKAELLVLAGQTEEAFASLKTIADQSPSAAYSTGRLAFLAKKYDEAVNYYRKTIAQNPNHLQARYELVQALMALSDTAGAKKELEALAGLVPKDDAQTQAIVKGLGELIK